MYIFLLLHVILLLHESKYRFKNVALNNIYSMCQVVRTTIHIQHYSGFWCSFYVICQQKQPIKYVLGEKEKGYFEILKNIIRRDFML